MAEKYHLGGWTNTVVHQENDGTIHVEESQDCQSILDANQRKRDHRFNGVSPEGGFQEAFDIPMVLVEKWRQECGAVLFSKEHMAYMNAKLKQPEFKYLSTSPALRDPHIIVRGAR